MRVHKSDDLRTVAFKVCTAVDNAGVTAVLTGGSAATVYAPAAYQSRDLDFVIEFVDVPDSDHAKALTSLGYREHEGQYVHLENPLTLEFPPGPLSVGKELITKWDTLREGERLLHILRPTDCCKDRLAAFEHPVDLKKLRKWFREEGREDLFREFQRELDARNGGYQLP